MPCHARLLRGYTAGAGSSRTRDVRVASDGLTQVTVTTLPGRQAATMAGSASGEETARPFAVMITSPAVSPAASAAVPQSTPSTSAPESTGATETGTPAPASVGRQPIWDGEPAGSGPRLPSS